jgi:hypothetical protein
MPSVITHRERVLRAPPASPCQTMRQRLRRFSTGSLARDLCAGRAGAVGLSTGHRSDDLADCNSSICHAKPGIGPKLHMVGRTADAPGPRATCAMPVCALCRACGYIRDIAPSRRCCRGVWPHVVPQSCPASIFDVCSVRGTRPTGGAGVRAAPSCAVQRCAVADDRSVAPGARCGGFRHAKAVKRLLHGSR